MTWIPQTCTLPAGQVPMRLDEFDALFVRWLREVARPEPLRLRLGFAGGPDTVDAAPGGLVDVSVLVPAGYEEVLDGVVRQAVAAAGLESP
ncbi:hypothetical protein F4561_002820 [Lipingzhangella halophila]|uniref:Uncharacterized protein n=1 Tax=Lipingzhangella halophila TaxID=1783352 RepID=A0A7W7RHH9_9ACTN|nr:hypothetical protein [Lipingzhangella halophila]MBB4932000.1 hypothetical protein [Lipingzhangella halophila]